eukprot:TRINITY_DN3353_c1_g1_i1.p1 TRINITY_DN3353_c1_g1~~TRINITY_DN3353_c1_g1_i1.p1  ORF type:complete len:322 (+),score=66.04 TRINITY_DN3353_c1_g1_i1:41-1006(+)
MKQPSLILACGITVFTSRVAAAGSASNLQGGLLPKIDPETWPVWTPDKQFQEEYANWVDQPPSDMLVWCKGFIPDANASGVQYLDGKPVIPLELPGVHWPLPGYKGMCAQIDGRNWAPSVPFESGRPSDSRFAAYLKVAQNRVTSNATCGFSHNFCCEQGGCGSSKYGEQTCGPSHCPDQDMQVRRVRCWTNVTSWTPEGVDCSEAKGTILAVKAYVQGRGSDPCVRPFGKSAPAATWDIGMVLFPTKRRVMVNGYVDDAPATECYAQAREKDGSTSRAILAQMPMPTGDVSTKLVGFSDRPLNPKNEFTYFTQQSIAISI